MPKETTKKAVPKHMPSTTPQARENRLISMAMDLAEKQMAEGTASSQVIVHYLKLGTIEKKAELEKLKSENELLKAKVEAIKSGQRTEELYANALSAMMEYKGETQEA